MSVDTDSFSGPTGLATAGRPLRDVRARRCRPGSLGPDHGLETSRSSLAQSKARVGPMGSLIRMYPLLPLCLGLVLVLAPSSSRAAMVLAAPEDQAPPPQSQPQQQSASAWLRTGDARERDGDYVGAAEAYLKAFEGLRGNKQRANEGAKTSMFCADAYRLAFDADGNIAHLDAAHEILERWLTLAGPDTKATLRESVERTRKELEEVRAPLKAAEAARLEGDRTRDAELSMQAIEAMKVQHRPWSAVALLVARRADADIAAFDAQRADAQVGEDDLKKLQDTKSILEDWRKQRPTDDDSAAGPLIDQRLVEIQTRIDETTAALNEQALAKTQIDDAPEVDGPQPVPDAEKAEVATQVERDADPKRSRNRVTAITLLSVGGVATVAGAAMLGEGIAFSSAARRLGDAEEAKADELQQQYGDAYPRDQFDEDLQRFRDDARSRNIGFIAGGAVLLAGGLASGIAGAVLFPKKARSKGSGTREKLVLAPTVSRSQLHLSLTARF